jgi:hypothetical protein
MKKRALWAGWDLYPIGFGTTRKNAMNNSNIMKFLKKRYV